jgi:hypothetical protein
MRKTIAYLLSDEIRRLLGVNRAEYVEYVKRAAAEDRPEAGAGPLGIGLLLAAAAAIAFVAYGLAVGAVAPARAAYLILLCVLLGLSLLLFLAAISKEGQLSVESNWGGLGGGLGGWRVSSSVTFLCSTIALFVMLVIAVSAEPSIPDLRERYRTAVSTGWKNGLVFDETRMWGRRLYVKGRGSQAAINEFWNQVKIINPYFDDVWAEFTVPGAPAAAAAPAAGKK